MQIYCKYCGCAIEDTAVTCPYCNGVNDQVRRVSNGQPQTIEELAEWAQQHKLPLDQMRTYIGQDYKGPKAFGIYRDYNGDFVVYKNKADGTRAIRYSGKDEAYAVNELYQKMKERVIVQKEAQSIQRRNGQVTSRMQNTEGPVFLNTGNPVGYYENSAQYRSRVRRKAPEQVNIVGKTLKTLILLIVSSILFTSLVPLVLTLLLHINVRNYVPSGYYSYGGTLLYNHYDDWYYYDDYYSEWYPYYPGSDWELYDNYGEYSYYSDIDFYDWYYDSDYYTPYEYSNNYDNDDYDWDYDYDWDDDYDWDYDYDDWDSDW